MKDPHYLSPVLLFTLLTCLHANASPLFQPTPNGDLRTATKTVSSFCLAEHNREIRSKERIASETTCLLYFNFNDLFAFINQRSEVLETEIENRKQVTLTTDEKIHQLALQLSDLRSQVNEAELRRVIKEVIVEELNKRSL